MFGVMSTCLKCLVLCLYVYDIWCYVSMFKMFCVVSVCLRCLDVRLPKISGVMSFCLEHLLLCQCV